VRTLYNPHPDEEYANAFAMALLMPAEYVRAAEKLDLSTEQMAERFGVPVEVMALRRRDVARADADGS
jgi:Zn-dependent peptidase ImmA (M78 family)